MQSNPLRIMVVDDEQVVLTSMRYRLESVGVDAVTFTDGHSALESFTADPAQFDGVVTDLAMPEMSGAELAARIHAIRPHFPITILSGLLDLDDDRLSHVGACGRVRTLSKVASLSEILEPFQSHGLSQVG